MNTYQDSSSNPCPMPKFCKAVEITRQRYVMHVPGRTDKVYLTAREATIVALMIRGKRPKQIAWELNNSPHTINSHIANIKEKLACRNNFQLGFMLGTFQVELPVICNKPN